MTTQQFINENRTETFKKGDEVIMENCYEATFQEYKNKIWICKTDSYLDRSKQEVIFLEDFSGCFMVKYLYKRYKY